MKKIINKVMLVFSVTLLIIVATTPHKGFAQNMTSESGYEIIDPSLNAGGSDDQTSTSGDFSLLDSLGNAFQDERFESDNYVLGSGSGYTFMADSVSITYFQTNDSTMIEYCGAGGCYDRARFEFDGSANSTDTLYLVEISSDDWTTTKYVDGTTRQIGTTKDINDYLTESTWETGSWNGANIIGLSANTEYKLRIRSLNGDFSESAPGPEATITTMYPYVTIDLNIAGNTWSQSSPPNEIDLGSISSTEATTAINKIWIDTGSNAQNGITISVRDLNEGLYSDHTGELIGSSDADLASVNEGFGLKIDNSTFLPETATPGFFRASTDFNTGGSDEVGGLSTTPKVILCSIEETGENCSTGTGCPILEARAAIILKARTLSTRTASEDYTDKITFTGIGSF